MLSFMNKNSHLSSLLASSLLHELFNLLSAPFTVPPVMAFLSCLGHCVSLQSPSCHEHAQLAHFMGLMLQLSYAFPTFDQFDHLLLCSSSQMAGCYR